MIIRNLIDLAALSIMLVWLLLWSRKEKRIEEAKKFWDVLNERTIGYDKSPEAEADREGSIEAGEIAESWRNRFTS